jgi:regulator of protease activity HflC (stomatin/prohibitin superfamily)
MEWVITILLVIVLLVGLAFLASQSIRVIHAYQRGIVFRLGKVLHSSLEPGVHLLLLPPFVDRLITVDMRTVTLDVAKQDVMTKDSIMLKVDAVIYYKIIDPVKAVMVVENYGYATSQAAQSVLRSAVGQFDLEAFLGGRDGVRERLHMLLDAHTNPWGVQVTNVDITDIQLSETMQRALAKKAEAEQEQQALLIASQAELESAENLCKTARLMEQHPIALQLRYLQTAQALANDKSHTLIFPMPVDLTTAVQPLLRALTPAHLQESSPPPSVISSTIADDTTQAVNQPSTPLTEGLTTPTVPVASVQLPFIPEITASSSL